MDCKPIILSGPFDLTHLEMKLKFPIICIYDHPRDYPSKFVARLYDLDKPTNYMILADTLEEIRCSIPQDMHRVSRHPSDDPVIVESYI